MDGELISIIVPAYNAALYLGNCLDSILNQTYKCYEVLLVDDGSTDDTGVIADKYQKKYPFNIRVIHTHNQGVTKARFEGIKAAKGVWIGFVDADDEIEPDMYERLYYNAVQYEADISHCGHVTIVGNGERVHEFYNTEQFLLQSRKEGLLELLDGVFEPSLWTKLYRRTIIQELLTNSKMNTSIKYYEDLLMNYFLFKTANKSVYEGFCGYRYLAHNTTATRGSFRIEKVMDPVIVRKTILEDATPELEDIAKRQYIEVCIRAYAVLSQRQDYRSEATSIKNELIANKQIWGVLKRNDYVKLRVLLLSSKAYNILYGIYERCFQNKVYE